MLTYYNMIKINQKINLRRVGMGTHERKTSIRASHKT